MFIPPGRDHGDCHLIIEAGYHAVSFFALRIQPMSIRELFDRFITGVSQQ